MYSDSKGRRLSPGGSPYGSELAWDGNNRRSIADGYLKYLAFPQPRPDFGYRDFNFDTDPAKIAAQSAIYDPVAPGERPDLSAFHAAGGKLISYHGWADPGVPPESMLDFYAKITGHEGGIDAVRKWYRVFMISGMHHCRGGNAPNTFDFLPAIIAWVEKDAAPNGIRATQFADDTTTVERTRPLFAYPSVARYSGSKDPNDAANWREMPATTARNDNIDWIWAPQK
ncbi:MAG: tannase/feruloyl esterase family alpha/beta hydrolase [Janthinobacterium lividum]